jgi:XTP/dITP diphosphohydrolase
MQNWKHKNNVNLWKVKDFIMKEKLIFATTNADKMREVREILPNFPYEILSLKEAGINVDIEENGTTFLENAMIKAKAIHKLTGALVLADDSGLEIDAFDKAPSIYSARYLGHDTPYEKKNAIILERMKDVQGSARSARYVCAIAAILPDGTELGTVATSEGEIALAPAGDGGFGYDPIFWVPQYQKTMAQMTPDEKNAISHRGRALEQMRPKLLECIQH